jgi:tape measure domain-containing protein
MPGNFNISYLFNAIDKITPVTKKISSSFERVQNSVTKVNRRLEGFNKKVSKTTGAISSLGRNAFLKITAPIGLLVGTMIKSRAEMENTEVAFKTMLGSAEKATVLIDKIRVMAAKTPFGEKDLFENSKLLLNFGVNAEKIIPNLTMLGDIAGGNKDRFNRLSLAFAQVSSVGRLMGQDLLQMVNAGFNPLQIISEQTGRSMGDLKDIMSKGGISFDMVAKAMKVATSEGGKFFNLMEEGSKTTSGRFSTLMDTIRIELVALGKILEPFTKAFIERTIKLVEAFSKLNPKTKKAILLFGIVLATIPPLLIGFGVMIKMIGLMTIGISGLGAALSFLALANPFGLILLSLGLLILKSEKFRADFVTVMLFIKDIAGSVFSFFADKLSFVFKFVQKISDAFGGILDKIRGGVSGQILGEENIGVGLKRTETLSKTTSTLGLEGVINIKGAPSGSTAEMSTFGNAQSNLGLNMSFASGGI